jgi:DNA-binding SARP family transcriptional activator/predicted ATPase
MSQRASGLDLLAHIMGPISLTFLGTFEVATATSAISGFRTDKVRALLAYLALEGARPQRREWLAALFWPENDHQTALANLRLTLHRLRQTIDSAAPGLATTLFTITRSTVTFHAPADQVDVLRFQQLLAACEAHAHADLHRCSSCLARLQEAAELYRGELLAGFGLVDAPAFEEWLLLRRETLHHLGLLALHHLAATYEAQDDLERALSIAQRKLALDPYREETHRQVMRLLARSGYISQALAHYESCRRLLRNEVGVEPDAETVTLAEQIRAGQFGKTVQVRNTEHGMRSDLDSVLRTPHSALESHPPHNLPAEVTPFVGREREIADLVARLQDPGVRLLTLVGAGGIGKTRLSLAVAQTILDSSDQSDALQNPKFGAPPGPQNLQFPDGVFFVALAPVTEAGAIGASIAAALGLELRGGDPDQTLLQALHNKQMLIVLDNFEHLLEGGGLVAAILQRAPGVQLLATSRERLALRGEHLYPVTGLESATGETAAEALVSASVRLFVQSAQRAQASFQLNTRNVANVVRICRLVGGAPLALELAAAWAGTLPLHTIASEIEQRADFLAFDWRDAPERQRSLRAVFEWSWKLLNEEERRVLRGVSVFRGGFTAVAAQSMAGASWATLTSLTHKSLLSWDETQGDEGRYDFHELVRQFAARQLTADELAAVEAQHSHFYLTYVAMREQRMARHEPRQAAAEIQSEIDNVRQAWGWAARQQILHDLDASAFTLWQFYYFTGFWSEGAGVFQLAADWVRRRFVSEQGSSLEQAPMPSQGLLSKLVAIHASLLISLSKHDQAQGLGMEAIGLGEGGVSVEGEALGHLVSGQALRRKGQDRAAHRRLEQAIQLVQRYQQGEHFCEALPEIETRAYSWLCSIALSPLRDFAAARSYSEQRLLTCRRWNKRYAEAIALTDLVDIAKALGDLAGARRECQRVLQLAHAVGNRWLQAISSGDLGEIHCLLGEYSAAYTLTLQALTLFREVGDAINEIASLTALGRLCTLMGAYDLAHEWLGHFRQGVAAVEGVGGELLDGLLALALLAHYQGDEPQALDYAQRSWELAQEIDDRVRQAQAQVYLGHAYAGLRQWPAAAAAYQQALALYTEIDKPSLAAEPRAGLAGIALEQGDLEQALAHVEAILPVLALNVRVGIDEPFFIYGVCQRVLAATGDPRAVALAEAANRLLQHDAAHIVDDAIRRSFLARWPLHHAPSNLNQTGPCRWLTHHSPPSQEITLG